MDGQSGNSDAVAPELPLENSMTTFSESLDVDPSITPTSDADSALGDISPRHSLDSTVTIPDEVYQYPERHGRRYHGFQEGKYFLPNDEIEQDRLDLQHKLFQLTLGNKLCLAPIGQISRVLDIGTGTGIWAIEFADAHPEAEVIGTDISPIQPRFVPPNLRFQIADAEESWSFRYPFNFIHGRMLFSCFKDPIRVMRSAYDSLCPGGYLELQDAVLPMKSDDGTLDGTDLKQWLAKLVDCAKGLDNDWTCASKYRGYMKDAGFVDIKEHWFKWPINTWPRHDEHKERGLYCQRNLLDGIQGFSLDLLTKAGKSKEEIEVMLVNVRKDINNGRIHAYIPIVVVYGRRPGMDATF